MSKIKLNELLESFMNKVGSNFFEVYNEATMQYELGLYLRKELPEEYNVQFEKNVMFLGADNSQCIKKDVDILVYTENLKEIYAIQVKCPTSDDILQKLYSILKDVKFLEQLRNCGITKGYSLNLISEKDYYINFPSKDIKQIFSKEKMIHGDINNISIEGEYIINWVNLNPNLKYFYIEV